MNALNLFSSNQELTMSSREIAELTGKEHKNVLRDCDNLNESYEKLAQLKIEPSNYKDSTGRTLKCYLLTKMQTFDLLTGYNTELRIKVNRRWAELESKQIHLPQTFAEALQLAADQAKQLELQAPKIDYHDRVLQSKSLITTTLIAKDLGISAKALNKTLKEKHIIFNQSGTWVLYAKFQGLGYTHTQTYPFVDKDGNQCTSIQTYWTEKGRKFIFETIFNK